MAPLPWGAKPSFAGSGVANSCKSCSRGRAEIFGWAEVLDIDGEEEQRTDERLGQIAIEWRHPVPTRAHRTQSAPEIDREIEGKPHRAAGGAQHARDCRRWR